MYNEQTMPSATKGPATLYYYFSLVISDKCTLHMPDKFFNLLVFYIDHPRDNDCL